MILTVNLATAILGYLVEDHPDSGITNPVLKARLAAGLTQQVLATRAGLAIRTLARIEDGEDTKVSTLAAIADVLGVSVDDLIPERKAS